MPSPLQFQWVDGIYHGRKMESSQESSDSRLARPKDAFTTSLPPKEVMAMVETVLREGPEMVRVTITFSRQTVRVTISIKKAACSRN